jgi:hypothetical protein
VQTFTSAFSLERGTADPGIALALDVLASPTLGRPKPPAFRRRGSV